MDKPIKNFTEGVVTRHSDGLYRAVLTEMLDGGQCRIYRTSRVVQVEHALVDGVRIPVRIETKNSIYVRTP